MARRPAVLRRHQFYPIDLDMGRLTRLFGALSPGLEPLVALTIQGRPVPKERARMGANSRWYTPAKTAAAEQRLRHAWRVAMGPASRLEDGNLALVCLFYLPDFRVMDADNLTKLVKDSGNPVRDKPTGLLAGGAYRDDVQITAETAVLELDAAFPRASILLGRHQSSLQR